MVFVVKISASAIKMTSFGGQYTSALKIGKRALIDTKCSGDCFRQDVFSILHVGRGHL